jgi:hypothetical protein
VRKLSVKTFISSVVSLAAIAAGSLAAGSPALAAELNNDNVFTVVGQNNPSTDPANVQEAVNAAFRSVGGTVSLIGVFDFGSCTLCVVVPGPMTISGTGDPSVSDLGGPHFSVQVI